MLPEGDERHLAALRAESLAALEQVTGRDREVVYLDTPHYRNLGDSLIWAGALRYLSELGHRVVHHSHHARWRDSDVRRFPEDALILFSGGGNFGDLYPAHDRFRRHTVRILGSREIVVLPQSVHYTSSDAMAAAARDYLLGERLVVMVREHRSMQTLQSAMPGLPVEFCPDLAFGTRLDFSAPHGSGPIVAVSRHDAETAEQDVGFLGLDWRFSVLNRALWRLDLLEDRLLAAAPQGLRDLACAEAGRLDGRLLRLNLRAARDQYRGAGGVVTNRLHGHVLACLAGVPHWVADNSYGKVSRIFTEYSGRFSTAHLTSSMAEAAAAAAAWLPLEDRP
ncbi:MAG: polysaccharide pyruvyl transferase family protein [Propionicimonas sp.]